MKSREIRFFSVLDVPDRPIKAFTHEDEDFVEIREKDWLDPLIRYHRNRPYALPPLSPVLLDYAVILGYLEGR